MADELYERLLAAKGRKYRLEKAESRRAALLKRKREQERQIVELEVRLEAEQADVEQLTRMSLTHLFYTILRSKNEQLETERQQALAAALRLQEAKQALSRARRPKSSGSETSSQVCLTRRANMND
ncbi:hypothetical protein [Paenibacillus humicola]|uniref:hypothetical protein n=1 Tax=Paenibacillus humicola TaxID=3110540 RepID=UPI00237C2576|nr:hypothetical protein [Paenibacillus humicola]